MNRTIYTTGLKLWRGFLSSPTMCYIQNFLTFVPPHSVLQGSSVYAASWQRMQQELTWVLEKIMFSFVVGGSPLAVEDLYCIIQNYNVLLWCLEPYVNLVSPAVLCKLSLEENHAQCKVIEEFPPHLGSCGILQILKLIVSSIDLSPRSPIREVSFPEPLLCPTNFIIGKQISKKFKFQLKILVFQEWHKKTNAKISFSRRSWITCSVA